MYLPVPVLAAIGIAVLALVFLAFRRRGGDRDLIAPPRLGTAAPPPMATPPPGTPLAGGVPPHLEAEVRRLVAAGNKIEAIKQVRIATHLGLREAKEMVERM